MRCRTTTTVTLLVAIMAIAVASVADAQTKRKRQRERPEKPQPEPTVPVDRRDRTVALPGSPFNGRAYWLALAQCGGMYFKQNVFYSDQAARARAVKPDPKANTELTKMADAARRTATAFFVGAERFLVVDRGLAEPNAMLTYDPLATAAGDRLKSIDAAVQASAACPALYESCKQTFAKACGESLAAGK